MAEHRKVRMGIDVGGTHTKAVAIDNLTHEIIGKNEVKTTHDHEQGVAAGVVQCFENCLRENNIAPEDVVFVAHSTTQATNAFIEGDVAQVGVIGVAGGGLEGWLAKPQLRLKDITLDEKVGRKINNLDAGSSQFSSHAHGHTVRRCKKHHVASCEFGFFRCRKDQIVHKTPKRRIHGRHLGSRILARRDGANLDVWMAAQQTQQLHPCVACSSHNTGLDVLFLHVESSPKTLLL